MATRASLRREETEDGIQFALRGGGFKEMREGLKNLWSKAGALLRRLGLEDVAGQVMEFAVVVPASATIMVGTFWVGRTFSVYQNITRAAREGTKYAVLTNCASCGNALPVSSDVQTNYVNPVLVSAGLDPTKVQNYGQVKKWLENTNPQQCGVMISFSYPVQLNIPFTTWNASTLNVPTSVQMRVENQSVDGTCQ